MKTLYPCIFAFLFFSLIAGCSKKDNKVEKRSFAMGVTPWPGDFTLAEVDKAYSFINNHCDIVSQHMDDGIPYEEAYTGAALPADFLQDLNTRMSKTAAGKKVFLSVSALNLTRREKADYYAKSTVSATVKDAWKQLAFNDPKMVTAYINYISTLIDILKPVYVNYGVESNLLLWDPAAFNLYKDFLSKVYPVLKSQYPDIPFFVSFMVEESAEGLNYARQLLPYTDWIGLSSYPYTSVSSSANGNTDPALFPANYFERFINLDKNKPFAFAETGYIAENLVVSSVGLNKQGREEWQAAYLEKVLSLSNQYNSKLFIWFCHKDYDAGNHTLRTLGLYQDLFAFWEDTGLTDENDRQRAAYDVWLKWFHR